MHTTNSGADAGGQLKFTVERGVMDWELTLGAATFRIDQYGKVRGWAALPEIAGELRPRMTKAWERLKALRWLGRAGRLSDAKRAGLESYARTLNEAGL